MEHISHGCPTAHGLFFHFLARLVYLFIFLSSVSYNFSLVICVSAHVYVCVLMNVCINVLVCVRILMNVYMIMWS